MAKKFFINSEVKVGTNRGRPRIWLDGKRLTAAGFIGGKVYTAFVKPGRIVCLLGDITAGPVGAEETVRLRKVTGRPDGKPIIDMVGADVALAFPGAAKVLVQFTDARIEIVRGE